MLSPAQIGPEEGSVTVIAQLKTLLSEALASTHRPAFTMNFFQLDGYLRAIAAGPGEARTADWLPLVFGDQAAGFASEREEATITNALISLYTWHRDQALAELCELPFAPVYSPIKEDRLDGEQWARGFMQGYIFWQDIWSQILDEYQTSAKVAAILPASADDEIDAILANVSCVADAEYATMTGVNPEDLTKLFSGLPQSVIDYGRLGRLVRSGRRA
jgi:uncharacterized protein